MFSGVPPINASYKLLVVNRLSLIQFSANTSTIYIVKLLYCCIVILSIYVQQFSNSTM